MDVSLPGMNGLEANRFVRARFPRTQVVMLTTLDSDALSAGVNGFLAKPPLDHSARDGDPGCGRGLPCPDPAIAERAVIEPDDPAAPEASKRLTPLRAKSLFYPFGVDNDADLVFVAWARRVLRVPDAGRTARTGCYGMV